MRVILLFGFIIGLGGIWLLPLRALAQSDEDYFRRLGVVQRQLERQKAATARPSATERALDTQPMAAAILPERRFFALGQTWSVELRPRSPVLVRKSEPPRTPSVEVGAPLRFNYKVTSFDIEGRARIEVREQHLEGSLPADPRVDYLVLWITPRFVCVAKEVHYRDSRPPLLISHNGQINVAMGFDPYPVDLPDLGTLEGVPLEEVPPLLARARGGIVPEPRHALDFRFRDWLARPVRAIWFDGEVWPAYYENTSGTAILLPPIGGGP